MMKWEEAVQWLKEQPDKDDVIKSCYYDDPLLLTADRFSNSDEWQTVSHLLQSHFPGKVLDLGAGRGISSYAFAKKGCEVTALEPDSSALVGAGAIQSLVEQTQLSIQIVQEYGEVLPFPENTFDVVYGRAVLHHARNLQQLCQEAKRVLKPGGYFLATREHVISHREDLLHFFETHELHHLYGGENAFLLKEYIAAIQQAGLSLKKVMSPLETPINYAPLAKEDIQAGIQRKFARFLGQETARKLAETGWIESLYIWLHSRLSNTPGRLYSFLAIKP